MSETMVVLAEPSNRIGPGRLILVVGPSGAGKDTLLGLAKAACSEDSNIIFPRRVVTREASSSEDNEPLSSSAFRETVARGDFAIHWEAHGHSYGLRRGIEDHVRAGRTVVINVSRTIVDAARRTYADVKVISITAPPAVLAERLALRARNSDGQLTQRLGRIVAETVTDITIVNVGSPEDHARQLVRIIRGESS
jgi:ribose 1,5-bisphosphokinase